ncbi:MAG: hypothetical protein JW908_05605 [Anaerolineales bacterium]|nr:hypothetical protein [Anaerolineales bacterium]
MGIYDDLSKLETQSPTIKLAGEEMSLDNKSTRKATSNITSPRKRSSENPREVSRDLPSRDEIQGFSFQLRDELKVKVQAEVPFRWQKELEDLARELNVKKLELYRFIIGEFLGKVKRKSHV